MTRYCVICGFSILRVGAWHRVDGKIVHLKCEWEKEKYLQNIK